MGLVGVRIESLRRRTHCIVLRGIRITPGTSSIYRTISGTHFKVGWQTILRHVRILINLRWGLWLIVIQVFSFVNWPIRSLGKRSPIASLFELEGHRGFFLCVIGAYGKEHSRQMEVEQWGRKWRWKRKSPWWQLQIRRWQLSQEWGVLGRSSVVVSKEAGYRYITEGRLKGYLSRRLLIIRVKLFSKKINPFRRHTRACPGCLYRQS